MNDWNDDAVVPDCHCQHVSGGRCMFAASPPKPEPLTPERLAAIGKVSYEPTIDQLVIKGRIARGAADYEGFLMAMSPYVRVEESVREAHAGSRSADSSATPDADAPVGGLRWDEIDPALLAEAYSLAHGWAYAPGSPETQHMWKQVANEYRALVHRAAATSSADAGAGGLADLTAGEVAEWLDSSEGRIEDVFGLWVQGKRNSRWVAEQLIDEGHLRRLAAATSAGAGPSRYHSCAKHYPCEACVVGLWCDEHDGVRPVTTSSADA